MSAGRTLFEKIWSRHVVAGGPGGQTLLYIDRHLLHEGATHAFARLGASGRRVRRPAAMVATADHYVPTANRGAAISDPEVRAMVESLGRHTRDLGIDYFGPDDARQGIVHVIGPEQGVTQPGITLSCGDSHTATHGALGTLAFGVGSTEVEHVMATQCLWQKKPRVLRVTVSGALHGRPGAPMTVDLPSQTVTGPDGTRYEFQVDAFLKECLLRGQDEIALTLGYEAAIAAFEERHREEMAWLG